MPKSDKQRNEIDWHAVEQDYRVGTLSLRELAQKHGCSHSAIANFASRNHWSRNRSLVDRLAASAAAQAAPRTN